jgi:phage tail sheath gpL-like
MTLSATSLAAAVGASVKNVQFQSGAVNVPHRIVVIGTYDPTKTSIVPNVPVLCTGPGDAAGRYGRGSMLHRLVTAVDKGSNGVEMYCIPQAEAADPVQAAGNIEFATSLVTAAGTLYLYVNGDPCHVSLVVGDTPATISTKVAAKITALLDLSITGTAGATAVAVEAKMAGPYGNDIVLSLNEGFNESTPAGVVCVITQPTGGTGIPDIDSALTALGTGDDVNELGFTEGVHGYGQDSTTLDSISTWNGVGNDAIGCYDKLIARPVRFLCGDTVAGSAGLADLVALGAARVYDRTNGVVAVPGSCSHPAEIAALAVGIMARVNNNRAAESYIGQILTGVFPGALADRWTSDYDSRDTAVKAGISPTVVKNGAVLLQNVLSFYHPDTITVTSNGYRSMRNISIVQNLLYNVKANFQQEKWLGISIVADVAKVGNIVDRQKARDIDAVMDDLVELVKSFEEHAWVFSAAFTLDRLKAGGCIALRAGGLGFDITLPVMLSGEGGIFDTEVQFDTDIAIVL